PFTINMLAYFRGGSVQPRKKQAPSPGRFGQALTRGTLTHGDPPQPAGRPPRPTHRRGPADSLLATDPRPEHPAAGADPHRRRLPGGRLGAPPRRALPRGAARRLADGRRGNGPVRGGAAAVSATRSAVVGGGGRGTVSGTGRAAAKCC